MSKTKKNEAAATYAIGDLTGSIADVIEARATQSQPNLSGAKISGDCRGLDFSDLDLLGADFSDAVIDETTKFEGANVKGAIWGGNQPNVQGAIADPIS